MMACVISCNDRLANGVVYAEVVYHPIDDPIA
jgi:hypothetical protein